MAKPKSTDIHRMLNIFLNTNHFIKDNTETHKKCLPLSGVQLRSLTFIQQQKQATMKDLADYLQVTAPTATVMANNLTESKLISRIEDKHDRRIIRLKITAKGEKNITETTSHLVEKINRVFSKLTREEIHQFISIIEKITQTK